MDNEEHIITIDTSTLSSASIGDIWFDTSSNSVLTYDNSQWVTISGNDINIDTLVFPTPVEWEHEFPDFYKVEEMCKEYPGLEKAYENFKTIYKMVEQDWVGKNKDESSN